LPDSLKAREDRRRRNATSYRDVDKHFVRLDGWLPAFEKYAKKKQGAVSYLTLCAKQAIDIRYFRSKGLLVHETEDGFYPTVAFVEKDPEDYSIIAESLGSARLSLLGTLEDIVLRPLDFPEQHSALRKCFPFDVLNLDFTGNVIPANDAPYSTTTKLLSKLLELQRDSDASEWHLFLTFRARLTETNKEANKTLLAIIANNLENDAAKAAYGDRLAPASLIDQAYAEFLRIGIAKWLCAEAHQRGFGFALDKSYRYERTPAVAPAYNIVKLVAAFNTFRGDALPHHEQELQLYREAVPKIFDSRSIDVGARLAADAALRAEIAADLKPVLDEIDNAGIVL
jgi:hypothetical protein